jgi:uncharacterized membrane protein
MSRMQVLRVVRVLSGALLLWGLAEAETLPTFAAPGGGKIITFNVPGAGTGSGQGTTVAGINQLGAIAGSYTDGNNVSHSFLRDPDGKIWTFDPPGTAQISYPGFEGSGAIGLNAEGAVVGYFVDANFAVHAYIRNPDGKFITYDSPGACTTSQNVGCHGSGAWNINALGVAVGPYEDTSGNFVAHVAIRFPDGKFTTFAVPGSSMEAGQGTLPASFSGLNLSGQITGLYYDANNTFHGYLRNPDGKFVDFEAPGANLTIPYYGTFPNSLNEFGAITGNYLDSNSVYHGFVRDPFGHFTTFQAPGADTTAGSFNGTTPASLNLFGAITGYYEDGNNVYHGFVRDPFGHYTTIDAPGAGTAPGSFSGTFAESNNDLGVVAGYYQDGNSVYHGFVRYP